MGQSIGPGKSVEKKQKTIYRNNKKGLPFFTVHALNV